MIDDAAKGRLPQIALADAGVAVLVGAQRVHAVVDVDGLQPLQPDNAVELRQHAVDVARDVVPRVGDVAGVHAHAHLGVQRHAVQYLPQLLEPAAHLGALARHGLQQHRGVLLRLQDGVQRLGDLADAHLHALLRVAARVEVVVVAGEIFHPLQVVRQRHAGEFAGALRFGAGVDGVGRVGHQTAEAVGLRQRQKRRRVIGVNGFRFTAPGIAGKELERVGADGQRRFPHGPKALRGGQMTADGQHSFSPFTGPASGRPPCRFQW